MTSVAVMRARIARGPRRRGVRAALVVAAGLAWLASGVYTVAPTSVAVTRRFGAVTDGAVPPGVHWWWPWPVGRVDRVQVTRTFALPIGVRPAEAGQPDTSDPVESRWLTGDTNILQLRSKVSWRIDRPADFLLQGELPERALRLAVGAAFTAAASGLPVDDVLTSGRLVLREQVRARTQAMLDAWRVGVQVLAVDLEAVEAPPVVVKAFQDVQDARADRERLVSEAEAYANTTVPLARGEAEQKVNEALAFQDQRLNAARGDADRFVRLAAEHERSPALLEKRLYLETAERVLPRVRRYVLEPGGAKSIPIRILE
jgi:membrane protease subunit HflK